MKHLLEKFRYCPACGGCRFIADNFKSKRCADCGFTYYLNASAAVAAVVLDEEGRLLVVRRAVEPAKGTLDLPGGFVDVGETLEEAVHRELAEETGASIRIERWLFSLPNRYRYSGMDIPTVDNFFLCRLGQGGTLKAADDAASLQWMKPRDIVPDDFGLSSIREGVRKVVAHASGAGLTLC